MKAIVWKERTHVYCKGLAIHAGGEGHTLVMRFWAMCMKCVASKELRTVGAVCVSGFEEKTAPRLGCVIFQHVLSNKIT